MSMGSREGGDQPPLWVTTSELARGEGHLFYRRLNELLGASRVRSVCREAGRGEEDLRGDAGPPVDSARDVHADDVRGFL